MSDFRCKRCVERGRPANFVREPKCAWDENGSFNSDNWQCATALAIRLLAGEREDEPSSDHIWVRREDTSYAALYVPPHPEDVPDGEKFGEFRGGGFIALTWYKHRGRTDMIARIDAWDENAKAPTVRPLTLSEAEAVLENLAERVQENQK